MMCQFLLYNNMNQPYIYICLLPLELPSPIPPLYSSQIIELSSLCCVACSHQPSYTMQCIYMSIRLSQFISLSRSCVHKSIFYICISIPSLKLGSSIPFFQIPYICPFFDWVIWLLIDLQIVFIFWIWQIEQIILKILIETCISGINSTS